MKKKICCVIGTRPEIIKMAPVVKELSQEPWVDTIVVNTAQHRELADKFYTLFNIVPDVDLNIMKSGQTLVELSANLMLGLDTTFSKIKPDMVIGQGDTITVLTAALTSFYHHIPFAHVEAGLRTYRYDNPFPEEANRVLIARLASLHFAPTTKNKAHLIKENVSEANIHITGNTIVDAILSLAEYAESSSAFIKPNKRLLLVTVHRRENLSQSLENICQALLKIANQYPDVYIVFPMHANPLIQKTAEAYLSQHPQITICPSLNYPEFISLLKASYLVLTDSGGIQEEATILGKPVLILRETTERYEAVDAGVARLVGTEATLIFNTVQELLNNSASYDQMAQKHNLFGDGQAATRIVNLIKNFFGI